MPCDLLFPSISSRGFDDKYSFRLIIAENHPEHNIEYLFLIITYFAITLVFI
jgi:hypothetical protein